MVGLVMVLSGVVVVLAASLATYETLMVLIALAAVAVDLDQWW